MQRGQTESTNLRTCFSTRDLKFALAVEGPESVHLFGRYERDPARIEEAEPPPPPPPPRQQQQPQQLEKTASRAEASAPSAAATPTADSSGLVELANGLKYVDSKVGKGRKATPGCKLTVKYTGVAPAPAGGWKEFDSNQGKPLHFALGQGEVIRGWDEGVAGMGLGERAWLAISPAYGYGEGGYRDDRGEHIPPGAELLFDVELLAIDGEKPARAARPPAPPLALSAEEQQRLEDSFLPEGFAAKGKGKPKPAAGGGGGGNKKKKKKGKGKKKK